MAILFTNNTYPYKHWLTSLAVGPLIWLAQDFFSRGSSQIDVIGIYMLFIIFGLFFSLPVFVLHLLLFNLLIRKTNSIFIIKTILNLITIPCIFIAIKLIGGTLMTPLLGLYYSVALIICSFLFKVKINI